MKRWRRWLMLAGILLVLSGCRGGIFGGGPWSSGDRVLVAKCLYDTGLVPPTRYDVVVFKYPVNPVEKGVPRNYIKRLLGLPGEIIAILFGRLYRWAPEPGDSPPYPDQSEELRTVMNKAVPSERHAVDGFTTELRRFMNPFPNNGPSLELFHAGKFEVLRKPPAVQLAMRRIVYDNDFPAKDLAGVWPPRWQPANGGAWKPAEPNGFVLEEAKGKETHWVNYHHLLRPMDMEGPIGGLKPPKRQLITDELGYNSVNPGRNFGGHWVGDLMLECQITSTQGQGAFWMELSRGVDRFRARFDLASGQWTLYRQGTDGKPTELGSQSTGVRGPGTYDLRLANFDSQLTVWVNRDLPFGDGKEYHPPEVRDRRNPQDKTLDAAELAKRRGPTANDLEPASFGAEGGSFKVQQVRLWRNTYYINPSEDSPNQSAIFNPLDVSWDNARMSNPATFFVQPGHYLCLGDNSAQSSDGRTWGLVPERLMLGKAMMVYFPFSRAGSIR